MEFNRTVAESLLYLPHYNLTYCWIHKVASSSWNEIFFQLSTVSHVPPVNLHPAAQKFRPSVYQLSDALSADALKFFFVRHPFERLVSAFVDKFELASTTSFIYQSYHPEIAKVNGLGNYERPTFSHFVNYLLATQPIDYNDHWIPYYLHCHLCSYNYDVIGHMESFQEDTLYITARSRLQKELELIWKNRMGKLKDTAFEQYFKQLNSEQIEMLYEIYQMDFEMFNYNVSSYGH